MLVQLHDVVNLKQAKKSQQMNHSGRYISLSLTHVHESMLFL